MTRTAAEGNIVTDEQNNDSIENAGPDGVGDTAAEPTPQYGVGPFSIREVAIGGVWLVAFVVSFFSISMLRFDSVWTSGIAWILTIGVPTVAVFLLALRRLSPDGIRRVGSLGIDQFASVAFSVAAVLWIQLIWETISIAVTAGPWVRSWVIWVEAVLMLAGVVLTVFAPLIPGLAEDFHDRREIVAHRNARPVNPVSPRPAAPVSSVYAVSSADAQDGTGEVPPASAAGEAPDGSAPTSVDASAQATPEWATSTGSIDPLAFQTGPVSTVEAFWALVPAERDVVDDTGVPVFRIGPDAWALVIEDRGESFVVRHEDGRIGYLHDVSGVTRG